MSGLAMDARAWWRTKPSRERRALTAMATVVVGALAWLAAWQPLVRDLQASESEALRLQRELVLARRDAEEAARLARASLPPVVELRTAVDRALVDTGLRSAVTSMSWQERRVTLTFAAVEFDALIAWLERLHRETGLHLREASISALVQQGTVRADLVLAR
jgi:type II secretory pathway component PulM